MSWKLNNFDEYHDKLCMMHVLILNYMPFASVYIAFASHSVECIQCFFSNEPFDVYFAVYLSKGCQSFIH